MMERSGQESDPWKEPRKKSGVLGCRFRGEFIPMLLRNADIRKATKDYCTFSSDAPFRVPIPSEEDVRTIRQLPIETDPPEHTEWRKIVEPFFKRPKQAEVSERISKLVGEFIDLALERESIEIVHDFALPLQSRALTYLLNVPESEAEVWIAWGIHVFRDLEAEESGADNLESYLHEKFDQAIVEPGEDFFSALSQASYQGRSLTREEMLGFANLAFAGGRDTVIHTLSSIMAYFAAHPEALEYLREDPKRVVLAAEEFFRVLSPITHLGRVCPRETDVHGFAVKAEGRVSLCWASANRDEEAFEAPDEVRLDRKPNPHLAFGSGAHLCLGALHTRVIVRHLLEQMSERVASVCVLESAKHVENEGSYLRHNGYDSLVVRLTAR